MGLRISSIKGKTEKIVAKDVNKEALSLMAGHWMVQVVHSCALLRSSLRITLYHSPPPPNNNNNIYPVSAARWRR